MVGRRERFSTRVLFLLGGGRTCRCVDGRAARGRAVNTDGRRCRRGFPPGTKEPSVAAARAATPRVLAARLRSRNGADLKWWTGWTVRAKCVAALDDLAVEEIDARRRHGPRPGGRHRSRPCAAPSAALLPSLGHDSDGLDGTQTGSSARTGRSSSIDRATLVPPCGGTAELSAGGRSDRAVRSSTDSRGRRREAIHGHRRRSRSPHGLARSGAVTPRFRTPLERE